MKFLNAKIAEDAEGKEKVRMVCTLEPMSINSAFPAYSAFKILPSF